jgi:enterochelin esterase-like enzyme
VRHGRRLELTRLRIPGSRLSSRPPDRTERMLMLQRRSSRPMLLKGRCSISLIPHRRYTREQNATFRSTFHRSTRAIGQPVFMSKLDGSTWASWNEPAVFENLIAKHEMPVTIMVALTHGTVWKDKEKGEGLRYDRTYEWDSTNDNLARFIESELLPAVEKQVTADGRPIRISRDPNDRAIAGLSSGGIGAFTAAWQRPDLYSRVISTIGTFITMRGGDEYPG